MSQNFSLAFLLLIFSPSISAQDSTSIDELIVTATKNELSADQNIAPVAVSYTHLTLPTICSV